MSASSYDAQASHRNLESEFERLRIQATAGWEKELRILRRFGLRDGMAVLEVGSGPGFVTECLLSAFPSLRLTAVEVDTLLAQATHSRLSALAGDRLQIVTASILDSGLPSDAFDFAIARLVFQHLPDPLAGAREILRLLRPGGRLAIIDCDDSLWGLSDPPIPEIAAMLSDYGQAQAAQGGDRFVGRRLWRILDAAGFQGLELEAIVNHSDQLGLPALLPHLDPDRLLPLVTSGIMDPATLAAFRESLARFEASPKPMVLMLLLLALGEKP